MIAPPTAVAQRRDPTPSASELWKTYPLHQEPATPSAAGRGAGVQAPGRRSSAPAGAQASGRRSSAPAGASGDAGVPTPLLGALGAVLVLAGFEALRRWDSRRAARFTRSSRPAAPVLLAATVAAMTPDERPRTPRLTALTAGPADEPDEPARSETPAGPLKPPDPGQTWTAEIEWQDSGGGPHFCLIARPAGGGADALIAASEPLAWPPSDADAIRQMRNEVARMEAALTGSGWTPIEPGSAWYSKRFAWAALVQPVTTGRFWRDLEWPAGTEDLWRCEIRWKPGYVNSRFTVVTTEPGHRRGKTVATSETFKWLLMEDPSPQSPEQREQVRALDDEILAAGWEPAGRGRSWCARRYVWRREGPPPAHLAARHGGHDGER